MTKEELNEFHSKLQMLNAKLTTSTNVGLVDATVYLDEKEHISRKECLHDDFKKIETIIEDFKIVIAELKTLLNI
jgi:hypothetical protein